MRSTSLALCLLFATGCTDEAVTERAAAVSLDDFDFGFDFNAGTDGWVADFADYGVAQEPIMDLDARHAPLPDPLVGGGFMLTGDNHSDDLFMYLYRQVDGLAPKTTYTVDAFVEFATSAPSGCSGIGGAPGEDVTVKLGATNHRPTRYVEAPDTYRVDVDKGNQSSGGSEMAAVGDIGNGTYDCFKADWLLKSLSDPATTAVTADENGSVWLLIGTDSGHEGPTTLYYTRASFRLVQL
jgi:hypothetical protein